MTVDARATGVTTEPKLKRPTLERARFPLVWKLFGLTALLILFVVAIAVGITIQRASGIGSLIDGQSARIVHDSTRGAIKANPARSSANDRPEALSVV